MSLVVLYGRTNFSVSFFPCYFLRRAGLLSVWHVAECNIKIVCRLTIFFLLSNSWFQWWRRDLVYLEEWKTGTYASQKGNWTNSMERENTCCWGPTLCGTTVDSPRLDTSCNLHIMLCFDCFDHFQAVRFVVKFRYFVGQISTSRFEWRYWIFQRNVDR